MQDFNIELLHWNLYYFYWCKQTDDVGVRPQARFDGYISIGLEAYIYTLPTTPESCSQFIGIPNSLYREIAISLVLNSAYTLCSTLQIKQILYTAKFNIFVD
jgi:hypothetical protein